MRQIVLDTETTGLEPGQGDRVIEVAAVELMNLLPTGEYRCALPGSAAGRAWIDQPERGFTIVRASRYRSADGAGTYLMTGREVRFTGGPMKGTRLLRVAGRMLRESDAEGVPGRLRCLRTGPIPDRR